MEAPDGSNTTTRTIELAPDVSRELSDALATDLVAGGRTYVRPTPMTFQHRQYILRELDASGIVPLVNDPELARDADVLAVAMVMHAYQSGRLFTLLAGLLVASGETWTPALAEANAREFASIADPAEEEVLAQRLLWLVLDFFLTSGPASATFLKYMMRGARNGTPAHGTRTAARTPAATPISATTPPSSAPLPITGTSS